MFKICDRNLHVLAEESSLSRAKTEARKRANELTEHVFFVCGNDGIVIAGFYTGKP